MSKKERKKVPKTLPDLEPLGNALADVHGLVNVAYQVVVNGDDTYGESAVLRFAVEAIDRVVDQLDDAERQLARFRKEW
jgi:hypothetical protein